MAVEVGDLPPDEQVEVAAATAVLSDAIDALAAVRKFRRKGKGKGKGSGKGKGFGSSVGFGKQLQPVVAGGSGSSSSSGDKGGDWRLPGQTAEKPATSIKKPFNKQSSNIAKMIAARKAKSTCRCCGKVGHWAGDAVCRGGSGTFSGTFSTGKSAPAKTLWLSDLLPTGEGTEEDDPHLHHVSVVDKVDDSSVDSADVNRRVLGIVHNVFRGPCPGCGYIRNLIQPCVYIGCSSHPEVVRRYNREIRRRELRQFDWEDHWHQLMMTAGNCPFRCDSHILDPDSPYRWLFCRRNCRFWNGHHGECYCYTNHLYDLDGFDLSDNDVLVTDSRMSTLRDSCCGVVDTACGMSVCGFNWWNDYLSRLKVLCLDHLVKTADCYERFKFGNGGILTSEQLVTAPVVIAGVPLLISFCLVDSDGLSLLLGRDFLEETGAEINIAKRTLKIRNRVALLNESKGGHFSVDLHPESYAVLLDSSLDNSEIFPRRLDERNLSFDVDDRPAVAE